MTSLRSVRPALLLYLTLWSAGLASAQVDPRAEALLDGMGASFSSTPQLEAYESLDTVDTLCFTLYEVGEAQPEMCTRMVIDQTNRRMMQETHMTFEDKEGGEAHVTKTFTKTASSRCATAC